MENSNWRIIKDKALDGTENMAIDYAILKAVGSGEQPPTLRFYKWANPTITIGHFQSVESEVHLDAAQKRGIDVIRRITGGGTVFHHLEITYSFVIPINHKKIPRDILQTFNSICSPIIKALIKMGVPAEYQPINDITAAGKKISGNAQVRKNGAILQHGTILLDINKNDIKELLTGKGSNKQHIIDQESGEKIIKEVDYVQRVGSLSDFLGKSIFSSDFRDKIESKIQEEFENQFNEKLKLSQISDNEKEDAKKIEKEFFDNPKWNNKIE